MINRKLKIVSFALCGLMIATLVVATIVEKIEGTAFVAEKIYGASWFVGLWAALTVSAAIYLISRKMHRAPWTLLVHVSFVVILAGAFATWIAGEQGCLHLREGEQSNRFVRRDGLVLTMPFSLKLNEFEVLNYKGTQAPMDFISHVTVLDADGHRNEAISMNNILSYRNYRFYQSGYDPDGRGATLMVSCDPVGIGLTYMGYALLLLSFIGFFFSKKTIFRQLVSKKKAVAVAVVALWPAVGQAAPSTLPRETADLFGNLYVYYNDRVCPFQTLAKDFTVKLYGKPTYKGLTAEQVLTGWYFYYDDWKEEPCIKIKSAEVRQLLGIEDKYASLRDFFGPQGFKLDADALSAGHVSDMRGAREANEKFSLASSAATASVWKIFPYSYVDSASHEAELQWFSLSDRLPYDVPREQATFYRRSMNYVAEHVAKRDFVEVNTVLEKIRQFQEKEAAGKLPSAVQFKAEKLYNNLNNSRFMAMAALALGIVAFAYYCRAMMLRQRPRRSVDMAFVGVLAVGLVFLCLTIVLRGIVAGHVPLSNGHETMQMLAACAAAFTFWFRRRLPLAVAFGYLVCGLALLVSMMGQSNPQVTQLMPVLASPLLSIHVAVIMIAYTLFAFMMFNGVAAVVLRASGKPCDDEVERLSVISRIMLYPAVFLLAVGIFVGAVWANVSWGRYWGWDPKETWALITMLVYAAAMHSGSIGRFRKPMFFHVYCIVAFLTVIVTYFGVNFLLGGMHSYA